MKYRDLIEWLNGQAVAIPDWPEEGKIYSPSYINTVIKSVDKAIALLYIAEHVKLPIHCGWDYTPFEIASDEDFELAIVVPAARIKIDELDYPSVLNGLNSLQVAWKNIEYAQEERREALSRLIGAKVRVDLSQPWRDNLYLPAGVNRRICDLETALEIISKAEKLSLPLECRLTGDHSAFEVAEERGEVVLYAPDEAFRLRGSGELTYKKCKDIVTGILDRWKHVRFLLDSPAPEEVQSILREIGWIKEPVSLGWVMNAMSGQMFKLNKPDAVYEPHVVRDRLHEIEIFAALVRIAEKLGMTVMTLNPENVDTLKFVAYDLYNDHMLLQIPWKGIKLNHSCDSSVHVALDNVLTEWERVDDWLEQDVPEQILQFFKEVTE